MPKRISLRLDALLMAYKGAKPVKSKTVTADSVLGNVRQSTVSNPFGSAYSDITPVLGPDGKQVGLDSKGHNGQTQLNSSFNFNPTYGAINDTATTGLQNSLNYLNQSPEQAAQYALSGNDPYYNVLHEQAQRNLDAATQAGRVGAANNGLTNSTALGGYLGQLQNDNILRQNQILQGSMDYGRQAEGQNLAANQSVIGGLAGLLYPLGQQSNNNLLQGLTTDSSEQQQGAQAQNAANLQYAQAMDNYNASQGLGGLFGAAGGIAGSVLGSLAAPGAGSIIGGALGGGFGNSLGGTGYGGFQTFLPPTVNANSSFQTIY